MAEEVTSQPENSGPNRDEKGRFLPGRSGNPNGPAKHYISLTRLIKRKLLEVPHGEQRTRAEILAERFLQKAEKGDAQMEKLVWNYMDGLPKATLDLDVDKEGLSELTEFFRSIAKKGNQSESD